MLEGICQQCGRTRPGSSLLSNIAANLREVFISTRLPESISQAVVDRTVFDTAQEQAGEPSDSDRSLAGKRSSFGVARPQPRALGAGLISIERLSTEEPAQLLLKDFTLPESRRVCGNCGAQLHRTKGYCPKCGLEYALVPTLKAGDLVAGQYEIRGPIAFGGLGWIYLAWDKMLSRLVVLKGLLNSKDEISAAAALQERRYLAIVKHPNIVGIHNFVSHGREGFIVMEFINGKTIKELRKERGPLPVAEGAAYIHRILSSFSYLHRMGLIYCDFKPDNFMLEDDDVKLIDMGAIRRVDDLEGEIFCTKGYAPPEMRDHPTVQSDLYCIARTLAVLVINFRFQAEHQFSLPTPKDEPLFQKYDSLYRFLLKATRTDPTLRFKSADEMAEQLLGILRECAPDSAANTAIESSYFESNSSLSQMNREPHSALNMVSQGRQAYALLPELKVDMQDPGAKEVVAAMAQSGADLQRLSRRLETIAVETTQRQHRESIEAKLRLADVSIQLGFSGNAQRHLDDLTPLAPHDWRLPWYKGKALLAQERLQEACACFENVYSELPGEVIPKMALAISSEYLSRSKSDCEARERAKTLYQAVCHMDHGQFYAIFGLARCLLERNEALAAVEILQKVPPTSNYFTQAQLAIVRALLAAKADAPDMQEQMLVQASIVLSGLPLKGYERHRLSADLLLTALELSQTKHYTPTARVLGCLILSSELRRAAERELRACATFATTKRARCRLVDEANAVRPLTWI